MILHCMKKPHGKSEKIKNTGDKEILMQKASYIVLRLNFSGVLLPFLRDENGKYVKNPEFVNVEDK